MRINTILPQDIYLDTEPIGALGQPPEQIILGASVNCEGILEDKTTKVRLTARLTKGELEEVKLIFKKIATRLENTNLEDHQGGEVW